MSSLESLPGYDGSAPLLSVSDLHVRFGRAEVVNGVEYAVDGGRTLAVLGESGSGKSVTARAIMGLVRPPRGTVTAGSVRLRGVDLLTLPEEARRRLRATTIAMIFQDALSALNPVLSVGYQIAELFRAHRGLSRKEAGRRAVEVLDLVRIPAAARRARDYPHQFSGGMRQRVGIGLAIALNPQVIIADEPTTALDVTVQAQILRLLGEIQREHGTALVLITHDMGVVADVADEVAVMYAGRVVERGGAAEVYAGPAHPYTKALLGAIPRPELRGRRLAVIPGAPPDLAGPGGGCRFLPRCGYGVEACAHEPPAIEVGPGRLAACHEWKRVAAQ
ncbi:peptide/nickel transport system ATP-binding protein/oligopeptide transport system ATP-binding protein [Nonomuraea solani]|uniref:Peptide/nickel transport system ATP-binding protein/oligopeptide transport system ATP-binding protein n=1 Tax=Nonomuraea solani TaxID=1144553 RepID=A0A1H5WAW6_9ACTN|nr:ABC transporter ATP-binding protein [Nonomuraea solani]SEF96632.1 peptide/nickel transport system ATP-binding protein/oligopeptide transport system ATP-binding protein [Nonomuraea solani]